MRRQNVLVVSDSRSVAASVGRVLRLLGYEPVSHAIHEDVALQEVTKACDWIMLDLDHSQGISPYIHLANLEMLPTIFFVGSGQGWRSPGIGLKEAIAPVHSYLVNKYGNVLSQAFDVSTDDFFLNHFSSLSRLTNLCQQLCAAPRTGIPNPFRNISRILSDFGMAHDSEILGRLSCLDVSLCQDPRERALNRLRGFHAESNLLEKQMVADLIIDNVRYLQEDEPTRRVLWIEDQPNRAYDGVSGRTLANRTLRDLVVQCFGYYRNMSVFLMEGSFEQFFADLHQQLRASEDPQSQARKLFCNINLEKICGQDDFSNGLGLDDFEAVLVDLYFGAEERVSGKDLIGPLTEISPDTPIIVFSRSSDPEVIDEVLRSGGDFYINKSFPTAVPVFVNRCYDGDAAGPFFVEKSRARLYLRGHRHCVRIRIDGAEELASKAAPDSLTARGAVLLAEGLEQRDEEGNEFIFRIRNIFRWREAFLFTDEVEGLGRFVECQGPNRSTVYSALVHFGLDSATKHEETYLQLYRELNCPSWLRFLRRFHDKFGELVFGSTSGILTTLGMLLGVYVAVKEFSAIMAAIAAVAASDSWSDAYSMYSAKLAERSTSKTESFRHASKTFLAKVCFPLFFMLVLWGASLCFDRLQHAVLAVVLLGAVLLAVMSAERPLVSGEGRWGVAREVGKNLLLAFLVLLCSGLAGYGVDRLFRS